MLLECSGTKPAECNAMKRNYGCNTPVKRRKPIYQDAEINSEKKIAVPPFLLEGVLFF